MNTMNRFWKMKKLTTAQLEEDAVVDLDIEGPDEIDDTFDEIEDEIEIDDFDEMDPMESDDDVFAMVDFLNTQYEQNGQITEDDIQAVLDRDMDVINSGMTEEEEELDLEHEDFDDEEEELDDDIFDKDIDIDIEEDEEPMMPKKPKKPMR